MRGVGLLSPEVSLFEYMMPYQADELRPRAVVVLQLGAHPCPLWFIARTTLTAELGTDHLTEWDKKLTKSLSTIHIMLLRDQHLNSYYKMSHAPSHCQDKRVNKEISVFSEFVLAFLCAETSAKL